LAYAGGQQRGNRLLHAVLVNDQLPDIGDDQESLAQFGSARPVRYDPDRLRELAVVPVRRSLISPTTGVHHNPHKLAKVIMLWFHRKRPKRPGGGNRGSSGSTGGNTPEAPPPTKPSARERIASLLALLHLSPS
jgi:hypothetical protein